MDLGYSLRHESLRFHESQCIRSFLAVSLNVLRRIRRWKSFQAAPDVLPGRGELLHRRLPRLELVPDVPEEPVRDFALADALVQGEVHGRAVVPGGPARSPAGGKSPNRLGNPASYTLFCKSDKLLGDVASFHFWYFTWHDTLLCEANAW